MRTEYKVVPAPERARKVRGLKGPALFAHEVELVMNELASEGWTYLRTDTLPHEERSGLTNRITTYRNLLVFHRTVSEEVTSPAPAKPAVATPPPPVKSPPATPPVAKTSQTDDPDDEVSNLWEVIDIEEEKPAPSRLDRQR